MDLKEIFLLILAILILAFAGLQLVFAIKKRPFFGPLTFVFLMLAYVFALLLAYRGSELSAADLAQTILTIGLVFITAIYAWSTAKIAKANAKMAEEMREQRYAEELPLLVPEIIPEWNTETLKLNEIPYGYLQTGIGIKVKWHNLGKGAAINSRFSLWTAPLDSNPGKALFLPPFESVSIGVNEQKETDFHKSLSRELLDINNMHHPRLEAVYQDIYERKINTIQEFRIEEEDGRKMAFIGELYFKIDDKRLGEDKIND